MDGGEQPSFRFVSRLLPQAIARVKARYLGRFVPFRAQQRGPFRFVICGPRASIAATGRNRMPVILVLGAEAVRQRRLLVAMYECRTGDAEYGRVHK